MKYKEFYKYEIILGEGDREEEREELREEDDLEEAECERRLGGDPLTMAKFEVSWPAIFINFA